MDILKNAEKFVFARTC